MSDIDMSADLDTADLALPPGMDQGADTGASDAGGAATDAAKPASIDDAISAAFAKHQQPQQGGQPRDEAGRFAAKAAEEAAAAAKAATQAAQTPQQAAAPVATQMPAAWGKDKAALWAAASPELQAQIAAREAQVAAGFQRYDGLAQYADLAERNGVSLKEVFGRAKSWEDGMARDPIGTLQYAMKVFNVDPSRLVAAFSGQQPQQGQQPAPQQRAALPPEVVQELQALKSSVHELRTAPVQQQVEAFFTDPANKYAPQLSDAIASILKMDRSLSLKDAYDRACWMDPQVRAALLAEQAQTKAAEAVKTARTSTQTALRASKSLTGAAAPTNGNASRKLVSIDDAINAAYADHGLSR